MSASATSRAIAALRSGRAIEISGESSITVAAVETATQAMLDLRDKDSSAGLLISGQRAAALNLSNERNAADPAVPVVIAREAWLNAATALALVDPGNDLARAPAGPLRPLPLENIEAATAALQLVRLAGLLPALWLLDPHDSDVQISVDDLLAERAQGTVEIVARARLPLQGMPPTQIVAFRAADDGQEHVALVIGAFGGEPPLVRLHSECLTGDVFGSLKCDCGPQLHEALHVIAQHGGGILLYLRQEGRGIGLANKIRAYALQDRGFDTVDANRRLGFADDEREYWHAAAILRALGATQVRLLTNNPNKVAGLESAGIEVTERVAHQMAANPHNADYLATKRRKSGHLLS